MQDEFSILLSRFDELSNSEREQLEGLAVHDPSCLELLGFAKRLFAASSVDVGSRADRADLVEYVLASHFRFDQDSAADSQRRRLYNLVEASPDVKAEVEALFVRLDELNRALPPLDHFEKLTGIRLGTVPDRSAIEPDKSASSDTVREPRSPRPAGSSKSVHRTAQNFRRRTVVRRALPALLVLVGAVALGIRLTAEPDVSEFVRVEITHPEVVERVRSTNVISEAYLERLRTDVLSVVDIPGGPFKKFDEAILLSLKDEIEISLDSTTANPTVERDELLFLIASVNWALGDYRLATLGFGTVAGGDGPRSPAARRALQMVEPEAHRRGQ